MAIDLMLVDDEEGVLDATVTLAQLAILRHSDTLPNLEIVKFYSGVDALNYLREHIGNLPRGYVVDMRMPFGSEELGAPTEIYRFLERHNATEYFRFYTGHISEHDLKVQEETGAEILVKGRDSEKLEALFVELARTKPTQ